MPFHNLRIAVRHLSKSPGFTATAVLMLALGIGATTAVFSVLESVLLRPLPFPHPDRLVSLGDILQGADVGDDGEAGVTAPISGQACPRRLRPGIAGRCRRLASAAVARFRCEPLRPVGSDTSFVPGADPGFGGFDAARASGQFHRTDESAADGLIAVAIQERRRMC